MNQRFSRRIFSTAKYAVVAICIASFFTIAGVASGAVSLPALNDVREFVGFSSVSVNAVDSSLRSNSSGRGYFGNVFTALSAETLGVVENALDLKGNNGRAMVSTSVVLSQTYGGGGNANAIYTNDFIEIFNLSNSAVNLTGWSVQYASSTGTTWTSYKSFRIDPGRRILPHPRGLRRRRRGCSLPSPDATGGINMSATNGKIALVSDTTALDRILSSWITSS